MQTLMELWDKYQWLIRYAFFGIMTTVINIYIFKFCKDVVAISTVSANVIAWVVAIAFAYITNRNWVFGSDANTGAEIVREFFTYIGCRWATGVVETVFVYVTIDCLHYNYMIMKVISNILVIVLNFVCSKLIVFRKRT